MWSIYRADSEGKAYIYSQMQACKRRFYRAPIKKTTLQNAASNDGFLKQKSNADNWRNQTEGLSKCGNTLGAHSAAETNHL